MTLKKTIQWRKTVRKYNLKKEIKDNDIATIVKAGWLAPTSLGLEVINIIVIRNKQIKSNFATHAMYGSNAQKAIGADSLVIVTGTTKEYLNSELFLKERLERQTSDENELAKLIEKYKRYLSQKESLNLFASEQAHISASFIVLQAADLRIGSTIMGGFDPKKSDDFLEDLKLIDKTQYHSLLLIAVGYYNKKDEGSVLPRVRIKIDEFVKIIK